MAERVKFPNDPVPQETGSGQGANIPLPNTVAPVSEQKLGQEGDDDDNERVQANFTKNAKNRPPADDDNDDDDDAEQELPNYQRDRIGSRIGQPLEEAQRVDDVEKNLDKDDVVACLFPRQVRLQDSGLMHIWEAGVHLVPVSIAGRTSKERHWWLKHNKVRHAGKVQKNPNADDRTAQEADEDAA